MTDKDHNAEISANEMPALSSSSIAGKNVSLWMKTATKAQKMAYMAAGEPQAIELTQRNKETGDFYTAIYPALRGIMFTQACKTPEEARQIAEETKKRILEEEDMEAVDEVNLEITGEGQALYVTSNAADMNVESVLHIGTMLGNFASSMDLDDLIEDINFNSIRKQIPGLADMMPSEDEDEEISNDELFEIMSEMGLYGFILQVSVPVFEWSGETSMRSTGARRLHSVYGDTYAKAIERGVQWANKENERMRQKPIKAKAG